MRVRSTRAAALATLGIAVFLSVASTAWACYTATTTPYVSVSPGRAPAASRVTVTGKNWAPEAVVVRWGSAAGEPSVTTAASAGDGSFTVSFPLPADAEPGVHYVYVVQDGRSPTKAAAVEVLAPRSSDAGTDQPQEARTAVATSGGARTPERTGDAVSDASLAAPASPGAGVEPSAPAAAPPARGDVAMQRSERAAAGTPAPASAPGVVPATPASAGDEGSAAGVSARSASGEIWPGFTEGSGPSAGPSLTRLPAPASGPSGTVVGMGVLVGGLAALFAGFGLAELRRRRAGGTAA